MNSMSQATAQVICLTKVVSTRGMSRHCLPDKQPGKALFIPLWLKMEQAGCVMHGEDMEFPVNQTVDNTVGALNHLTN
jgi:hypothetical protein